MPFTIMHLDREYTILDCAAVFDGRLHTYICIFKFQRLHRQLYETDSFHIFSHEACRRRTVRTLRLEQSILNFVADRRAKYKNCYTYLTSLNVYANFSTVVVKHLSVLLNAILNSYCKVFTCQQCCQ